MRAMLPPVTIAGTIARSSCDFAWGRQTRVGKADLLPMVDLMIQQIAAASISTNRQLGLLALWRKGHTVPTSGLCPHEGTFHPNEFHNIC
jgi:hypothetical protein